MVQSRRHVPSMPIMWAENPRSNVTRSPLRRSVTDIFSALEQFLSRRHEYAHACEQGYAAK
jgi:hypothetical protein